jgi:hypothetical protein
MAYCAHADAGSGIAWVGEAKIAEAFGLTVESVRNGRRRLEEAGLLIDTGQRRGRCKVFRLVQTPQAGLGDGATASPKVSISNTPSEEGQHPKRRADDTPSGLGTNRREQKRTKREDNRTQGFRESRTAEEQAAVSRLMAATTGGGER